MPMIHAAPQGARPPRTRSRSPSPTIRLGAAHDALLQALLTYVYLTSELACRLLYRPGSLTYVRAAFKALDEVGLVRRLYLRQRPELRGGSAIHVFTLSARGLAYLKRAGFVTWPRYHAQEQVDVGSLHLRHHLGTASTLILAELLSREIPELSLERLLAERPLRREFRAKVPVSGPNGQTKTVSIWPDGYLEFRFGSQVMPIALEYDRGTESRRAWQEKVAGLLAYAAGPFQAAAERRSLTVAVLTPHSEKRRRDLQAWTSAVVGAANSAVDDDNGSVDDYTDLFRIAYADPDQIDPWTLFLSPLWYRPHDTVPEPLLATLMELPR